MDCDEFNDRCISSGLNRFVHLKKTIPHKKTMGNDTNMENWAARERLRWIERAVWWRGWVGRPDLAAMFGISAAQASSDLQRYQELNPGALAYHLGRKRYEGTEGMRCVMHEPSLVEAMNVFLGGGGVLTWPTGAVGGEGKVDVVQ
ncbi:MAG: helix-turn-helix domain containing protein, partial [Akkermansiaceae bacterium]|nr:helix-turn-helix domain containing protein [Akkermansiaceae bacterium]